jgi:uncharacterized membrane protein
LDALRGLMMILMALDHARFFVAKVHPLEIWNAPLPQYRNIASFITRFFSHLCAPGFFFLMGVGMALFAESRRRQGWSEGRIARHFVLRGLLVLFLQQFVVNPAWFLGTMGSTDTLGNAGSGGTAWFNLDVLYGLGACMAILLLLLRANGTLVAAISLGAVGLTQILLPAPDHVTVAYSPLARMLLVPGQTGCLLVLYPILPWVGIAGLGLAFGKWVARDCARAFHWLPVAGVVFLAVFVVVRALGGFGNFHAPDNGSWVAFLNMTKYPPSLAFTLFTLGADLLLLALFSRFDSRLARCNPLMVFGRTALFFYIVHLYLYALGGFVFAGGGSLGMVYGVWLVGLVVLYPLCRWYGRFKAGTAPDGIWRFF